MSLKQTAYFMAVVGGTAGLCCWALQLVVAEVVTLPPEWMVVVYTALMGGLIGGFAVAFSDHWTSDGVAPMWVLTGVLLGMSAGALGGLVCIPVFNMVVAAQGHWVARLGRVLAWATAGSLIGLVTGLRWGWVNPKRAVHGLAGGLLGGLAGGLMAVTTGMFELGPILAAFIQPLPLVLTGVGINLGITVAPILLRDAVVEFVSSSDPRAQRKYGNPRQEWVIQDGDQLVIGSQGFDATATLYSLEVHIFIPDSMVHPKHAVIVAERQRLFVEPHSDNTDVTGQPLGILQLDGVSVVRRREIRVGDELVVGQTVLRVRAL